MDMVLKGQGASMTVEVWLADNAVALVSAVIAAFALWVSISTRNRQMASTRPAMMAVINPAKNGAVLSITLRNRADHPMQVGHISTDQSDVELAEITSRENLGDGDVVISEPVGGTTVHLDVNLSSAGHPKSQDKLKREYALLSRRGLPQKFWLTITYDPHDTKRKLHSVKREVEVPPQLVGNVTAVARPAMPRYSLAANYGSKRK
ncbi:MAG: hypothetical protein ABS76_29045 [Pelagibacterium sp. SCN 64-44]|nr:MAG: hypothetical protein ABS76_29045 [Pelagibacterium sp. SCN 64-44]